jgi:peptidoglycan/LPS O-acetylase OafA/YrhL
MVICCLLVAFTGVSQNKKRGNIIYRGLSHRWSVKLGQFSYSLYLVHQLILSLIAVVFAALGWKTGIYWLVLIVLGTPLAVASSYLFHIIFERPFMHPPSKANKPWQSQQLGEAQETVTTTS